MFQTKSKSLKWLALAGIIATGATASWAQSSTSVGGKIYFDITNITAKTPDGTKISPSGTGADVKRFYVGVSHKFDSIWSASIKSDAGYSSADGHVSVFIKTAYIQAKLNDQTVLQAGSADMPWIPFVEGLYGFRYVENTLTDKNHVANSADWGLHLKGKSDMVSYNFAVVNGGGYKHSGRSKSMDLGGRVSVEAAPGLTLAAGAYTGKLGKDSYSLAAGSDTRDAMRWDLLAAYVTKQYRCGVEYYTENNWGYTLGSQSDKSDGVGIWGSVKISDPYTLFARYDDVKPSKDLHPDMKEHYFNFGVQYAAMKGVDIALVYKHDTIDNQLAGKASKTDEIGVFSQIAF